MSRTILAAAACVALLAAADRAAAQTTLIAADGGYASYENFSSAAGYMYSVNVSGGGSYAGISTTVGSGSNGISVLGSTATLEAGVNDSDDATTVSVQWRTRTYTEANNQHPPLPLGEAYLCSDVLNLQGVQGAFALQMNYSPDVESAADAQTDAPAGALFLGWFDSSTGTWLNAANMSSTVGTDAKGPFLGSFAQFWSEHSGDNLADYAGYWGVNTSDTGEDADSAWAILDGLNGQFAVVPEPGTLAMTAAAALALLPLLRRKRAAILRGLNRWVRVESRQFQPTRLVGEN